MCLRVGREDDILDNHKSLVYSVSFMLLLLHLVTNGTGPIYKEQKLLCRWANKACVHDFFNLE